MKQTLQAGIIGTLLFVLFLPLVGAAIEADVGDRVRIKATHHDGVPVHPEPRGTHRFVRVPDGSEGVVQERAEEGHWLRIAFDNGVSGWVTQRYLSRNLTQQPETPPIAPAPPVTGDEEAQVWSSPEGCRQILAGGRHLEPRAPDTLRLATWNIRWFPKGCSASQSCEENATDIPWLACTIAWIGVDVVALQEILDDPPARLQLSTLTAELNRLTQGDWAVDLQECGAVGSQHVGFLWNEQRVTLSATADEPQLNGAAADDNHPACAGNIRPGRYARLTTTPDGIDMHLLAVHFDSGTSDRDFQHRRAASAQIPLLAINNELLAQSDQDIVVLGDFNTMGRQEAPPITATEEITAFDGELAPGFRRLVPNIACSEYFDKQGGLLDHVVVATGMQEAPASVRVSGYCAVLNCAPVTGALPAAYERLSDHCPVITDISRSDND